MRRNVLALGLAFAIPAFLVTNESFRPIDERVRLESQSGEHRFNVRCGSGALVQKMLDQSCHLAGHVRKLDVHNPATYLRIFLR